MKYDISKTTAPKMPNLGRGLESVALLLSQVSKDMHQPIVPMLFPILGAHVSGAEFMYPDLSWKEPSGMLANLVADSGAGKGQLSNIVEAVCRDFRTHDEEELAKLVEWQKMMKTKSANKEKPVRPDVAFWFPPADVTNAAFIQNAMGCEKLGQRTQYLNMPEVEMADRVCGGHRQISQMMRNIYDRQRAGALRATADGVTGNPVLRANITISSTPFAARKFYKNELFNGTFGRVVFSYKPRLGRDGRIPRQGKYGDDFYKRLDEYLARLAICKGRFIIRPLNRLIDSSLPTWLPLPTSQTTTPYGTSPSVLSSPHGKPDASSGRSTTRRGQSPWAASSNGSSTTTSGPRCRSLPTCSAKTKATSAKQSAAGRRIC